MFVIGPEPKPTIKGDFRTFRVWLDTNQYQKDMERIVKGEEVHIITCKIHTFIFY